MLKFKFSLFPKREHKRFHYIPRHIKEDENLWSPSSDRFSSEYHSVYDKHRIWKKELEKSHTRDNATLNKRFIIILLILIFLVLLLFNFDLSFIFGN